MGQIIQSEVKDHISAKAAIYFTTQGNYIKYNQNQQPQPE